MVLVGAYLPDSPLVAALLTPTSSQPWLTIGSISGGEISYSYAANTTGTARTADITLLDQALTITQQATPVVSVTDNGGTYDGSPFPATATVNGSASLEGVTPTLTYYSGTSVTGTALAGAPSAAGTYTVVASFAGSTDYGTAGASVTFTIAQAVPTLIVLDGGTYDISALSGGAGNGPIFPATALVAGVGSQSASTASLEGVTPTITAYYPGDNVMATPLSGAPSVAGEYTVVASFAGSADYTTVTASTSFIIRMQEEPITPSDVLMLIDDLNEYGPGPVSPTSPVGSFLTGLLGTHYLDPAAVLEVIDYLNQNPQLPGQPTPFAGAPAGSVASSPAVATSATSPMTASLVTSGADTGPISELLSDSSPPADNVGPAVSSLPAVNPAVIAGSSAAAAGSGTSAVPAVAATSAAAESSASNSGSTDGSSLAPAELVTADALFSEPSEWWRDPPPKG